MINEMTENNIKISHNEKNEKLNEISLENEEENKENNNKESKIRTIENKEVANLIPQNELLKMQAQIGNHKQTSSLIFLSESGETKTITKNDLDRKATIYFKSNRDSTYHVNGVSTKIMIENCHNCVFHFNERINTEMIELWNSSSCSLFVNKGAKVKTMQIDICQQTKLVFEKKLSFGSIVWSSLSDFSLTIGNDQVKNNPKFGEVDDKIDQFIIRLIKGRIMEEQVVRLANGFPTTDREADSFDRLKERNDQLYENHIRSLLFSKKVAANEKLEGVTKFTQKVGRNEKCLCGSNKKYKKCCEQNDKLKISEKLEENKNAFIHIENARSEEAKEIAHLANSIANNIENNNNNNNNN